MISLNLLAGSLSNLKHAAVNPHQNEQDSQREAEEFLCLNTQKMLFRQVLFFSSSVCT